MRLEGTEGEREKERETERQTDRQTDRQRGRLYMCREMRPKKKEMASDKLGIREEGGREK